MVGAIAKGAIETDYTEKNLSIRWKLTEMWHKRIQMKLKSASSLISFIFSLIIHYFSYLYMALSPQWRFSRSHFVQQLPAVRSPDVH